MIEKIKQLIYKIPYGLIPMVVVLICGIISGIISFFIYFKAPISMKDEKDNVAIMNMIQEMHPESEILNVELCDTVVLYPVTFDIIYRKSTKIDDEDDVYWYTKAVDYDLVNGNDTINYKLVFEIDKKFLRYEVGQFLFIVDKKERKIFF